MRVCGREQQAARTVDLPGIYEKGRWCAFSKPCTGTGPPIARMGLCPSAAQGEARSQWPFPVRRLQVKRYEQGR